MSQTLKRAKKMYKETLKIMMTMKMITLLSKTEKKAIIEQF